MTAKELKKKYLDFFKKKGHTVIPSASLVPEHDPTVLFLPPPVCTHSSRFFWVSLIPLEKG